MACAGSAEILQTAKEGVRLLSETLGRLEQQYKQELETLRAENSELASQVQLRSPVQSPARPDDVLLHIMPCVDDTIPSERPSDAVWRHSESTCRSSSHELSSGLLPAPDEQQPPPEDKEKVSENSDPADVQKVSINSTQTASVHVRAIQRAGTADSGDLAEKEEKADDVDKSGPEDDKSMYGGKHSTDESGPSGGETPGTPPSKDLLECKPSPVTEDVLSQAAEILLGDSVELCNIWRGKRKSLGRISRMIKSGLTRTSEKLEVVHSVDTNPDAEKGFHMSPTQCTQLRSCVDSCAQRSVILPNSKWRMVWDLFGMSFIVYDLVMVPLQVFNMPVMLITSMISWAATVYWTLDIPSTFLTGFHHKGILEMRLRRIAAHYARTWLFFDFAVVAIDWVVVVLSRIAESEAKSGGSAGLMKMGKFAKFLRTLRLLRLLKLKGLLMDILERIPSEAVRILARIVSLIFFIITVNHFIACGFFGIGSLDLGQSTTWVASFKLENNSTSYQYFTSLHWSLTQFTPASMEIVPKNTIERAYTVVTLIFAMVTFSSFVGSITNAMTRLRNLDSEEATNSTVLRRYLKQNHVSGALSNNIWGWMSLAKDGSGSRTQETQVAALSKLPKRLLAELRQEIYLPSLRQHPFFDMFALVHGKSLWKVYQCCLTERALDLGQELFTAGATANCMYFIINGSLTYTQSLGEVSKTSISKCMEALCGDDGGAISTLMPNQWVCEQPLWIEWQHCGHLVAKRHSDLFAVKAVAFQQLMQWELVEAWQPARYAKLYARALSQHKANINDVWNDPRLLRDLVTQAFTLPTPSSSSASSTRTPSTSIPRSPSGRTGSIQGSLQGSFEVASTPDRGRGSLESIQSSSRTGSSRTASNKSNSIISLSSQGGPKTAAKRITGTVHGCRSAGIAHSLPSPANSGHAPNKLRVTVTM